MTDHDKETEKPRFLRRVLLLIGSVVSVRFLLSPGEFLAMGKLGNKWIKEDRVLRLKVGNSKLELSLKNEVDEPQVSSNNTSNGTTEATTTILEEITTQAPEKQPFQGTKITPLSEGMDLLENVCLLKGGRQQPNQIVSFTPMAEQLRTSVFHYMRRPSWSVWTAATVGHNLSEWETMTQQYPLIRNETLLTLEIWNNPGHCLNDQAYSIALDASQRQLYNTADSTGPIYPTYLASFFKGLASDHGENNTSPSWCYSFLHDAGFINVHKGPLSSDAPGLCFERLLVPLLSVHRFPIDWKDPVSTAELAVSAGRDISMRSYSGEGPLYPAEILARLHDTVMESKNFITTPWPPIDTKQLHHDTPQLDGEEDVPVLLYTREGTKRRHWTNAHVVKMWLERDYHVQVKMVGGEWNELSPPEQASLYHNYSRIIAVHGAHLANLFYCRNNTRIVEIKCGRAHPEAKLSLREPPAADSGSPSSDWYGQKGWFSSATQRIGLEHFVYAEYSTSIDMNVKSFDVNPSLLVPFVASRLELVPRVSQAQTQIMMRNFSQWEG